MSLSMDLWHIQNEQLIPMNKTAPDLEKRLEVWVEQSISMLGIDALLIGRQVHTGHGGYVDLLAINSDGELIIIELKRNKTPRNIVAQCLDYGSWVYDLDFDDIVGIYEAYKSASFEKDFSEYFDTPVPEKINGSYQIGFFSQLVGERLVDFQCKIA